MAQRAHKAAALVDRSISFQRLMELLQLFGGEVLRRVDLERARAAALAQRRDGTLQ